MKMKKSYLILVSLLFCAAGCTSGYRVHVNGYSEPNETIQKRASIYVSPEEPNSQNPIFDKQVKTKIEELLKWYDYVPVSDGNDYDYRIAFQVGMNSHQRAGYEPVYHTSVGYYSGYYTGYHFGYSTYVPFYDTYYDRWLVMKVFSNDSDGSSDDEKVVWVGETMISTNGDDIRRVIDYLLVGCFEYFGADTTRQRSFVITEKDPKILQIESLR